MERKNLPVIGLLSLLFLLSVGLVALVFSRGQEKYELSLRYQLEQGMAQVITAMQFNPDIEMLHTSGDLPFILKAFALYDTQGGIIFSRGTVPPTLPDEPSTPRESLTFAGPNDEMEYVRRFSTDFFRRPVPDRNDPPESPRTVPEFNPQRRPSAFYIRAQAVDQGPSLYSPKTFVLLILLLAGTFFAFGKLYLKNQHYRRTLFEQQNLVTLGEAARTISHEIKNPLSAIGLRLSILRSQTGPESSEDLEIIGQEVDRLDRLASKIGQFLKNPAGDPQSLELRSFVSDLLRRFPNQSRLVPTESPLEEFWVSLDPDHLRSIIENLVVNGLESPSPEGIEIAISRRKSTVVVNVADRGPGIDPTLGDSVFKPFVTTKARGSGIGLAIARRFAEAAGGQLQWKPNPEGGTLMVLTLPEAR